MHTVCLSTLLRNMSVDDSAFDGFLRQVECMYAQGKASFEAVFNVS